MENEASAIARKIQNFIVIENQVHEEAEVTAISVAANQEPGVLKNLALVTMMGLAIGLTHVTLYLLKWVKKLEA